MNWAIFDKIMLQDQRLELIKRFKNIYDRIQITKNQKIKVKN
jgi:hypothetical protein